MKTLAWGLLSWLCKRLLTLSWWYLGAMCGNLGDSRALKVEGVSNIAKEGLTSENGVSSFCLPRKDFKCWIRIQRQRRKHSDIRGRYRIGEVIWKAEDQHLLEKVSAPVSKNSGITRVILTTKVAKLFGVWTGQGWVEGGSRLRESLMGNLGILFLLWVAKRRTSLEGGIPASLSSLRRDSFVWRQPIRWREQAENASVYCVISRRFLPYFLGVLGLSRNEFHALW